jgi:hypothetical protein
MKQYVEPSCEILALDPVAVVCGSFDSVDNTEIFTIEDFEII